MLNADDLVLAEGLHADREAGVCAMEAVAWMAGEPHSDHPICACPVISRFMRTWNDDLDHNQRQNLLKPLLGVVIGTRSTPRVENRRAYLVLDWLVREHAVAWLRLAGLADQADALAALESIMDLAMAQAAGDGVRRVLAAIQKVVANPAWESSEIAWFFVTQAAGRAAGCAARDATEAASWRVPDAMEASLAVMWVARDVSLTAARIAIWTSARAAMLETVTQLQAGAVDLIRRMAAVEGVVD